MLTCQICGFQDESLITAAHLRTHGIGTKEYHAKFPGHKLRAQSEATRAKIGAKLNGKPNPKNSGPRSEETKEKISASRKRMFLERPDLLEQMRAFRHTEESKQKMSVSSKGIPSKRKGIPLTEEHKRNLSEVKTGVPNLKRRGHITPDAVKQKISATLKGRKPSAEAAAKHRAAIITRVESPDYIAPMEGKTHSPETKEKIREAGYRNAPKVREKMEASGKWVPEDQVEAFTLYKRKVWSITNANVHHIPNYDESKRGLNELNSDNHQVDHIYSIADGFANNVDPEIIGHPENLRFIHWKENLSKWSESHITLDELTEKINTK